MHTLMPVRTPGQCLYTEILSVFAIVYDTDNILVVVDAVRREFVSERSCMF